MHEPKDIALLAQELRGLLSELETRFPALFALVSERISRVATEGVAVAVNQDWGSWLESLVRLERTGGEELLQVADAIRAWITDATARPEGSAELLERLERIATLLSTQLVALIERPETAAHLEALVMPFFDRLSNAYVDYMTGTKAPPSEQGDGESGL